MGKVPSVGGLSIKCHLHPGPPLLVISISWRPLSSRWAILLLLVRMCLLSRVDRELFWQLEVSVAFCFPSLLSSQVH